MIVIPAIDIRGGRVVRLAQGRFSDETVYSDSPIETALKWASYGVEMIHIVDLDGARDGVPRNLGIVKEIKANVRCAIEFGGGVRDERTFKAALDAGASKVVLGTRALEEDFLKRMAADFSGSLVVGIDASEGIVRTKGWVFSTGIEAVELARKAESLGVRAINYTDISKDGMLSGPNIDSLRSVITASRLSVVASGGVSTIDDVRKLKTLEPEGLKGMIIGKALYEGKIDLAEAVRVCKGTV